MNDVSPILKMLTREKSLCAIDKQAMWGLALYAAVLFYALTPGVLLSLPPGASHQTVNLTHAVVFGVVLALTHKMVCKALGDRM
jgi:hypothetical protein